VSDFESIYRDYFTDVHRYARSLTMDERLAEEITQETFFRSMRSLSTFRGDCEIRVWLCRIAKNLWLTEAKKRNRFTQDETVLERLEDERDFTIAASDKQTALQIHRALHGLDEPYREVFSMRVFGELSFREIGDLFDKSEHWACVTFHRAKGKIKDRLGGIL